SALLAFVISVMPVLFLSRSSAGGEGERLQETTPIALGVEDGAHFIAPCPVEVEAAMFKLDARSILAVGDEPHLDFSLRTRVVLEVRGELPVKHQARVRSP